MTLYIVLEAKNTQEVYRLVEDIHNSLAGNKNYIDSNIILSFDNNIQEEKARLYFSVDDCNELEYVREKAKGAVDIFINNRD